MVGDHEDLAASQGQVTIASAAGLCFHAFQQCLNLSAPLHPREFSLIEDQVARFSSWTSSIGVFARGRASMDHRLREAPEVCDAVVDLLEALVDNIQDCAPIITSKNLEQPMRIVASEIGLLYKLTNTIWRASRETQNLKAAKSYRIQDDDGNDAEVTLEEVFANYISGRFPSINDTLRQRLASSIVLRRKRILYRRSRYRSSPIKPIETISQPKIELPKSRQRVAVTLESPNEPAKISTPMDSSPVESTVHSVAASATTLVAEDFKRASTPSVISATQSV